MIENPNSWIQEIFACEIGNPGLWNGEYTSRNPESHERLESRIQVPLTNTGFSGLKTVIVERFL